MVEQPTVTVEFLPTERAEGHLVMCAAEPWVARGFPDVAVIRRGRVGASEAERVADAVGRLLERRGLPAGAQVRLTGGNCDGGPMVVQVNLRVGDLPVRMQAAMEASGDLLPVIARLDRQIGWAAAPWRPRPWPDRIRRVLIAPGKAVITRRKEFVLQRATPMQAVAMMDAMDYDVHLFTDVETGEDAVVYRAGPTGLRLARQRRVHPPASSGVDSALVVSPHGTPTLTDAAAVDRVCKYGLPFLFFTDPATGRGRLLYPRYDGGLTLIAPIDDRRRDDTK